MADKPAPEEYSPEETSQRLDRALRRSLATAPNPRPAKKKAKSKAAPGTD